MKKSKLLLAIICFLISGHVFAQSNKPGQSLNSSSLGISTYYQTGINIREYYFSANFLSYPSGDYRWDFGDGSPVKTGFNSVHQFSAAGVYNVCLNVLDGNNVSVGGGCIFVNVTDTIGNTGACGIGKSLSSNRIITISDALPNPNPAASVLQSIVGVQTAYFNPGNNVNSSFGPMAPGIYTLNIEYFSDISATNLVCFGIDTIMIPALPSDTFFCGFNATSVGNYEKQFDLTDSTILYTGGLKTTWDFGDGSGYDYGFSPKHRFPGNGTYTVCANTLDINGNSLCNFCQPIVVNDSVINPTCNYNWTDIGNHALQVFPDTSLISQGYTTQWNYGDSSQTTSDQYHIYSNSGTYNVCQYLFDVSGNPVCNNCQQVAISDSVNINPGITCGFSWNATGNNVVQVEADSSILASGYIVGWNYGDSSATTLSTTHTYANAGSYTVVMLVADSNSVGQCITANVVSTTVVPTSNCQYDFFTDNYNYVVDQKTRVRLLVFDLDSLISHVVFRFPNGATYNVPPSPQPYSPGQIYALTVVDFPPLDSTTLVYADMYIDSFLVCTLVDTVIVSGWGITSQSGYSCFLNDYTAQGHRFEKSVGISPANFPAGTTFYWSYKQDSTVVYTLSGTMVHAEYNFNHSYFGNASACVEAIDSLGNILCSNCINYFFPDTDAYCGFNYTVDTSVTNSFNFSVEIPGLNYPSYGYEIVFDYGDGTIDTMNYWQPVMNHHFVNAGTYLVCMSKRNLTTNQSCSVCDSVTVNYNFSNDCNINYIRNAGYYGSFEMHSSPGLSSAGTYYVYHDTLLLGTPMSDGILNFYTPLKGQSNICLKLIDSLGNLLCQQCIPLSIPIDTNNCGFTYVTGSLNPQQITFTMPDIATVCDGNDGDWFTVFDFGDGSSDTIACNSNTITHIYQGAGTYNVTSSTYYMRSVCISSNTVVIYQAMSDFCQANFEAATDSLNAYFVDMSTGNPLTAVYLWDFGDGTTSQTRYPQHTYASAGNYLVCLYVNNNGCSDSICRNINIVSTSVSNPTCNAYYVFTQDSLYNISIVNMSSGVNLHYSWDFGDGISINQTYPSHTYASTGVYNICLTVSDNHGCVNTYCDSLFIDSLGFQRRGFTVHVTSPQTITGVGSIARAVYTPKVFPNPFANELTINDKGNTCIKYQISGVDGRIVAEGEINKAEIKIETNELSGGVYILELFSKQTSQRYKLIKK